MTEIREKANEIARKYNLTEEEEEMIKMWLKDSFLEMVIKDCSGQVKLLQYVIVN